MKSRGRSRWHSFLWSAAIALGCTDRAPPSQSPPTHQIVRASSSTAATASASAAPSNDVSAAPTDEDTGATAPQPSTAPLSDRTALTATPPVPPLLDESGATLAQTEDLPSLESPSLRERMRLLVQAIAEDRAEIADPAFFPVVAYEQVKAIANPARDHRFRLMAAFHRNVHEYHGKVRKLPLPLRFVAIEPPGVAARWMKPGSEGNKLGYYRTLRSRLRFADAAGEDHRLTITSMISWRGEWYVVHLDGFE
ncbi:MAG: hypothetical protein QM784_26060 [Polyangiaceae bacterium]